MLGRSIVQRVCNRPEQTTAEGETAIDVHNYLMNQAELEQFLCYASRHFSGLDFGGHDTLHSILKLHTDAQLNRAKRSIVARREERFSTRHWPVSLVVSLHWMSMIRRRSLSSLAERDTAGPFAAGKADSLTSCSASAIVELVRSNSVEAVPVRTFPPGPFEVMELESVESTERNTNESLVDGMDMCESLSRFPAVVDCSDENEMDGVSAFSGMEDFVSRFNVVCVGNRRW